VLTLRAHGRLPAQRPRDVEQLALAQLLLQLRNVMGLDDEVALALLQLHREFARMRLGCQLQPLAFGMQGAQCVQGRLDRLETRCLHSLVCVR
jgi:hypothetical protein